jgi:hypothetical protein
MMKSRSWVIPPVVTFYVFRKRRLKKGSAVQCRFSGKTGDNPVFWIVSSKKLVKFIKKTIFYPINWI